jgi:hypothetical protein
MQTAGSKTVRFLILAAYLLVTAGGGLFHLHGSRHLGHGSRDTGDSRHLSSCDERTPPSCHSAHGRVLSGQVHRRDKPRCGDEESCPVCQFLAQKPIPATRTELTTSALAVQETARIMPLRAARGVSTAFYGRAPPAVA